MSWNPDKIAGIAVLVVAVTAVVLIAAGAFVQWGLGVGLLVAGAMLLVALFLCTGTVEDLL